MVTFLRPNVVRPRHQSLQRHLRLILPSALAQHTCTVPYFPTGKIIIAISRNGLRESSLALVSRRVPVVSTNEARLL